MRYRMGKVYGKNCCTLSKTIFFFLNSFNMIIYVRRMIILRINGE